MREAHPPKHVPILGELDVGVADDLDEIAPWVAEVEERARLDSDACRLDRRSSGFLVLDHQAEMAAAGRRGVGRFLQREEMVAEVDEGHARLLAAKLQGEELAVEIECLVDVADLDRNMVEADEPGFG